jgi:hypothetical protein
LWEYSTCLIPWEPGVLLSGPAVFALLYAWLIRNSVILKEHILKSTTFFTSSEIPYEDIRKAQIVIGLHRTPPYQMRVFHRNEQTRNPIVINIKLFSREDLKLLAHVLVEKAPQADLDDEIKRMVDGKMPSIFSIKKRRS